MERTTEYYGMGQSGYTAGRRVPDPALERELQARYTVLRRGEDDEWLRDEIATDDRWSGRGGPMATPEQPGRR